jgi:hypothetical protein
MLFVLSAVVGCKTSTAIPLPEPATNNGLAAAERELDDATAERLSKVSASIGISHVLAQSNPTSLNNNVLISELKLAKTLSGKADDEDWVTVKKRVEAALGGGDLTKLYEKEQAEAASLRNKLKDADAKYEAEKAKKQAEYNSKLAEKEIEIRNKEMELKQERMAKTMERFTWVGIGLLTAGILLAILAQLPLIKKGGMAMVVAGTVVGAVPLIGEEPWFKYAIGGTVGFIVLSGIIAFIISNRRNKVDKCTKSVDDTSPPTSD